MQELGSGKWGKITRFAQVNINSKLQSWAFNPVWFHVYYRVYFPTLLSAIMFTASSIIIKDFRVNGCVYSVKKSLTFASSEWSFK